MSPKNHHKRAATPPCNVLMRTVTGLCRTGGIFLADDALFPVETACAAHPATPTPSSTGMQSFPAAISSASSNSIGPMADPRVLLAHSGSSTPQQPPSLLDAWERAWMCWWPKREGASGGQRRASLAYGTTAVTAPTSLTALSISLLDGLDAAWMARCYKDAAMGLTRVVPQGAEDPVNSAPLTIVPHGAPRSTQSRSDSPVSGQHVATVTSMAVGAHPEGIDLHSALPRLRTSQVGTIWGLDELINSIFDLKVEVSCYSAPARARVLAPSD
jgi:hypothetical protein